MSDVRIFEVYIGEVTTVMWLCPADLTVRAGGRGARPPKELPAPDGFAGRCDDCARRSASTAPAVDFVPTSPEAFAPPAGWRPDPQIEPWPERLERLTREAA